MDDAAKIVLTLLEQAMAKPTLELLDWERSLIGDRGFIYAAGCLADQYKNPHTAAARGFKAYVKEMPSREEAIM